MKEFILDKKPAMEICGTPPDGKARRRESEGDWKVYKRGGDVDMGSIRNEKQAWLNKKHRELRAQAIGL